MNHDLPENLKQLESKMRLLRPTSPKIKLKESCLTPPKDNSIPFFNPWWSIAAAIMIILSLWSSYENNKIHQMVSVKNDKNVSERRILNFSEIDENTLDKSLDKSLIRIQVTHSQKKFDRDYYQQELY